MKTDSSERFNNLQNTTWMQSDIKTIGVTDSRTSLTRILVRRKLMKSQRRASKYKSRKKEQQLSASNGTTFQSIISIIIISVVYLYILCQSLNK